MFGVLIDLRYLCVMIPQSRIKFKNLEEYHIIINVLFSIGYSWCQKQLFVNQEHGQICVWYDKTITYSNRETPIKVMTFDNFINKIYDGMFIRNKY